MKQVGFKLLEM